MKRSSSTPAGAPATFWKLPLPAASTVRNSPPSYPAAITTDGSAGSIAIERRCCPASPSGVQLEPPSVERSTPWAKVAA